MKNEATKSIDKVLAIVAQEFNESKNLNVESDLKQLHILLCELRRRVEFSVTATLTD